MEDNQDNISDQERLQLLEKKVDELLKINKSIDHTLNPPFYKRVFLFIYNNFFTIIAFLIIAYLFKQLFDLVNWLTENVEEIDQKVETIKKVSLEIKDKLLDFFEKIREMIQDMGFGFDFF